MDRMQTEMDRLVLELKKTKIDLALAEERKAENELSLKHEIKYLIDKLMNERHKRLQAAAVSSGSRSMNRNASDYGFGNSSNNVSGVVGVGFGSPISRGDAYGTLQKSEYHGAEGGEYEEEGEIDERHRLGSSSKRNNRYHTKSPGGTKVNAHMHSAKRHLTEANVISHYNKTPIVQLMTNSPREASRTMSTNAGRHTVRTKGRKAQSPKAEDEIFLKPFFRKQKICRGVIGEEAGARVTKLKGRRGGTEYFRGAPQENSLRCEHCMQPRLHSKLDISCACGGS